MLFGVWTLARTLHSYFNRQSSPSRRAPSRSAPALRQEMAIVTSSLLDPVVDNKCRCRNDGSCCCLPTSAPPPALLHPPPHYLKEIVAFCARGSRRLKTCTKSTGGCCRCCVESSFLPPPPAEPPAACVAAANHLSTLNCKVPSTTPSTTFLKRSPAKQRQEKARGGGMNEAKDECENHSPAAPACGRCQLCRSRQSSIGNVFLR